VPILSAWGFLARIMPDVFQIRRESLKFLWGPKTIWGTVLGIGCRLGWWVLTVEARLGKLTSTAISVSTPADGIGLQIVSWGPTPTPSGCHAVIVATKLPAQFRTTFEVALFCGYVAPAVDQVKDTRISISQL